MKIPTKEIDVFTTPEAAAYVRLKNPRLRDSD